MANTLPIKTLPVLERWECKNCGQCCRGSLIWLDQEDLEKLRDQAWDRHPEMQGTMTIVREGWLSGRRRLAQRPDGSCVFLLPSGLCRIHAEHGAAAKPLICRMFPLQLVPLEKHAVLTTRRSCPTAAADQGAALETYRPIVRETAAQSNLVSLASPAPPIVRGRKGNWTEFHTVAGTLEQLMRDERFPLVRRIVHSLRFCSLLEQCRLRRINTAKLRELCDVLAANCTDVGELFLERPRPARSALVLFRQCSAEYLRLRTTASRELGLRQRWRFARAAVAIAKGKGTFPRIYEDLPQTTFEQLERPLGHLEESVQRPFLRYFETQVASKQYAIACRPGWSLIDSFRALAIGYPIGLWLLRLLSSDRAPTANDSIEIIAALDRGQGYAPLQSGQHRIRLSTLAKLDAFEPLVAWYAR